MKKLFLVACLVIETTGYSQKNQKKPMELEPVKLEVKTILQGNFFENVLDDPRQFIVATTLEWQSFIVQFESNIRSPELAGVLRNSTIDFDTEIVLAVFDEQKYYDGFSIDILNVLELDSEIVVTVDHLKSGGLNAVLTRPFHIVKIPKRDKLIVFSKL